jgi:hypothetical protein
MDTKPPIEEIASALQAHAVRGARAAELAVEVSRLNGAVLALADRLTIDDEPTGFSAVLEKNAR